MQYSPRYLLDRPRYCTLLLKASVVSKIQLFQDILLLHEVIGSPPFEDRTFLREFGFRLPTDWAIYPRIKDRQQRRCDKLNILLLSSQHFCFHLVHESRKCEKSFPNRLAYPTSKDASSRSQCSRGLRRRSAAARLLILWVRIPPGHGSLSVVKVCY